MSYLKLLSDPGQQWQHSSSSCYRERSHGCWSGCHLWQRHTWCTSHPHWREEYMQDWTLGHAGVCVCVGRGIERVCGWMSICMSVCDKATYVMSVICTECDMYCIFACTYIWMCMHVHCVGVCVCMRITGSENPHTIEPKLCPASWANVRAETPVGTRRP